MPKRRRGDRDNEVETVMFSIPEDHTDNILSSSTTIPTPTTTFSPPLPEQVFNVSEWTIESERVSTSNTLFSSMVEPVPSMSSSVSDHDLHIPGAYHNYDVVDVSDFQPPLEPLEPSRSSNTESTKNSKERYLFFLRVSDCHLIYSFLSAIRYVAGWDTSRTIFWNSSAWMEGVSIKHNRPADARCMNHTIDVEIVWGGLFSVSHVSSKAMLSIHSIKSRYIFLDSLSYQLIISFKALEWQIL
jgi:hypothetical protein